MHYYYVTRSSQHQNTSIKHVLYITSFIFIHSILDRIGETFQRAAKSFL